MSRTLRSILLGLALATVGVFLVHYRLSPFYWIWLPGTILAESLMRHGVVPRHGFWPLNGYAVEIGDTILNWVIYSAVAYAALTLFERRQRRNIGAATDPPTSRAHPSTGAPPS